MKKKRKQGKPYHRGKAHTVSFPRVGRVQLAPARESQTPFCADSGPHGETCSSTEGLEVVYTLRGHSPVAYLACPLHYGAVSHMVQTFLDKLKNLSQEQSGSFESKEPDCSEKRAASPF